MSRARLPVIALFAFAALASCGHEPTAPVASSSGTVALSIVGGDAQVGVAGTELPTALKVLALDDKGHPLRGFLVNFRVVSGGGSMFAGASLTDKDGYAQDYWTLGATLFTPQQVDVVAVDPTTGVKQNFGSFKARGVTTLGASLLVTPSSANLGSTGAGVPGAATTFTVQNTGGTTSGAVTTALSGANAADFQVTSNSCSGATLALGATCTLTARVNTANTGLLAATLTASASPGGSTSSSLAGSVTGFAHLDILPTTFNFGTVALGSAAIQQTFTVSNSGTATSGPLGSVIGGTNASQFLMAKDNCLGISLAPGGTCTVIVSYQPTTTGAQTATLTASGSPGGSASSSLIGSATSPVMILVTPQSIDFGPLQVGSTSSFRVITLQNQGGTATGPIAASVTGTNANDFGLGSGSTNVCVGASILPGQSCILGIAFLPSAGGTRSATVQLSATGWTASVSLFGSGLTGAPALAITPPMWDFGPIQVGTQSAPKVFTVTNVGTASTTGLLPTMTGPDIASFQVVSNTCNAPLAPGASCAGTVRFVPLSVGTKSAQVTISGGATASASLTGTATPLSAVLTVNPPAATFNATLGGGAGATFMVSNTGGTTAANVTLSLTGPQANEFGIVSTTCGTSLAPGASCFADVLFRADLNINPSAAFVVSGSPGGTVIVPLTGTILASGPSLIITPTAADFGTVKLTSLSSLVLTVSNNGSVTDLPTGPPVVTGTAFNVTINTCTVPLNPGASCTISMEFQPTAIGTATGTLTFPWNGGPAIVVPLTGIGSP